MASKLGVTALYVTPTQESGGPLTPRTPRIAATVENYTPFQVPTF